jgi:hypothetical protein
VEQQNGTVNVSAGFPWQQPEGRQGGGAGFPRQQSAGQQGATVDTTSTGSLSFSTLSTRYIAATPYCEGHSSRLWVIVMKQVGEKHCLHDH